MIEKKKLVLACLMFCFAMTGHANTHYGWTTFQENEIFSVSYQRILCDDQRNGVAFEFFAIRLENKSNQKINLQWFNSAEGEAISDEKYVSLILTPGEVMQGNCKPYANNVLMVLAGEASDQPRFADFKFYLL